MSAPVDVHARCRWRARTSTRCRARRARERCVAASCRPRRCRRSTRCPLPCFKSTMFASDTPARRCSRAAHRFEPRLPRLASRRGSLARLLRLLLRRVLELLLDARSGPASRKSASLKKRRNRRRAARARRATVLNNPRLEGVRLVAFALAGHVPGRPPNRLNAASAASVWPAAPTISPRGRRRALGQRQASQAARQTPSSFPPPRISLRLRSASAHRLERAEPAGARSSPSAAGRVGATFGLLTAPSRPERSPSRHHVAAQVPGRRSATRAQRAPRARGSPPPPSHGCRC